MKRLEGVVLLGIITIVGVLGISGSSSALEYQTNSSTGDNPVTLKFEFGSTLTFSSPGDIIISNLVPGTKAISDDDYKVTVSTNNLTGYTLYATVGCASGTNCNDSKNLTDGTNNFTMVSSTGALTAGMWGVSLDDNATENSNFITLAKYDDLAATIINQTTNNTGTPATGYTGTSDTTVRIGAYATASQVAGTYVNKINFIVMANAMPLTISDIAYMQDLAALSSSDKTSVLNSMTEGQRYQLKDARDQKDYYVSKLADGKIWMTENLAIDLTATTYDDLYGTGTNAGKMTNATSEALGYLKGNTTGDSSDQWAMAAVKKTWTSSYSYSEPWIAVDSSTSGICYTPTTWCVDTSGNGAWSWDTVTPATINGTTSKAQGKLGVYYNYCAASAGSYCWGNGTSTTGSPSSDPNTSSLRDITSDICPYGWHLPTSTNSSEFQALYTAYSSNATNFQTALSTPLSGTFYIGKTFYQGDDGRFWSSAWNDSTFMYALVVGSTFAYHSYTNDRANGNSVRCVFGS